VAGNSTTNQLYSCVGSSQRAPRLATVAVVTNEIHTGHLAQINPVTLYRILRLRSEVFVIEQDCVYADMDGRDLEPEAVQLWIERSDHVVATLRIVADPAGRRIGRVVTARSARSDGLGALLMTRALELAAGYDIVLDAQAYLARWYEGFGFARNGAEFIEDGIPHVPMVRLRG
jgi:ElaA protein